MKSDEHILCVDKVVLIETIDYICVLLKFVHRKDVQTSQLICSRPSESRVIVVTGNPCRSVETPVVYKLACLKTIQVEQAKWFAQTFQFSASNVGQGKYRYCDRWKNDVTPQICRHASWIEVLEFSVDRVERSACPKRYLLFWNTRPRCLIMFVQLNGRFCVKPYLPVLLQASAFVDLLHRKLLHHLEPSSEAIPSWGAWRIVLLLNSWNPAPVTVWLIPSCLQCWI